MTRLSAECISDLKLDQWQAGELSAQAGEELRAHVDSCARCTHRRQTLVADAAQFLQRFPEPPRRTRAGNRSYWVAGTTALAAAAALVLWLKMPTEQPGQRSKGEATQFGFFIKRGGQVTLGAAGQRVRAGDQLRFVVTTSKPQHIAIVGRDGSGAVFEYHAASGHSVAVAGARDQALESSIELDAAPGPETVWAIFCDEPFELAPLKSTLAGAGELQAPPGCTLKKLELMKDAAP
ncbi:MAG TPA: hypothetical protein VEQ59_03795 [Polyangiaceae bacterium]|nr:hypothetical protein [Polyangiaceae bacterium]